VVFGLESEFLQMRPTEKPGRRTPDEDAQAIAPVFCGAGLVRATTRKQFGVEAAGDEGLGAVEE